MEADKPQNQGESVSVSTLTGLDPVATAPSLGSSTTLLVQQDRRRAAEKLREKGWSYRRIAQDLGVPYILVSKWLNGDPVPETAPVQPRGEPEPRTAQPPANDPAVEDDNPTETIETLKLQYAALESYMQPMVEALERSRLLDADGSDARARGVMEQRITDLEATVAALQNQVRAMAGSGAVLAAAALAAPALQTAARGGAEEPVEAADPFADLADPFATATPDPFAEASTDPFAETTDPFAEPPDPFAEATPTPLAEAVTDPFAETTDPFAEPPDPFAEAMPAPLAEAVTDPFAETTDPFAGPADPFATATPDPFAQQEPPLATATPDPFAEAAADPFAAPAPDPFAEPPDPFAETPPDPFADPVDPFAEPASVQPEPEAAPAKGLGARLKFWKR